MQSFKAIAFTLVLAAALACSSLAAAADFQAGLDAYNKADYAVALKIWQPLAQQGDRQAQFALGSMYHGGKGVAKDPAESTKWYQLAAEQCDSRAMAIMGLKYLLGIGVAKDPAQSYKWLNLAYMYGKKEIKDQLLSLERSQPAPVIQEQRAVGAKIVSKRAKGGDPLASAVMSLMYTLGRGVAKDRARGYAWMDLALNRGFKEAKGLRDQLAAKMSKDQLAKAKAMAVQLRAADKKKK